jgi:hypothetical protein
VTAASPSPTISLINPLPDLPLSQTTGLVIDRKIPLAGTLDRRDRTPGRRPGQARRRGHLPRRQADQGAHRAGQRRHRPSG